MEIRKMRISATIEKSAAGNQACDTRVHLEGNDLWATFPWSINGKKGKGFVKGTCQVICDTDKRIFAVSNLSLSKADFVEAAHNGKWQAAASTLNTKELDELKSGAVTLISDFIVEKTEYLVDNHQDFEIDVRNSMEHMFFRNKGVSGSTTLTVKESDMGSLYDTEPKELIRIDFDASYKLEFDSGSKEEVLLKECCIDLFTAEHGYMNEKNVWQAEIMTLTKEEADTMKKRIIAAIEDNYNDVEYSINGYLGGNPKE